MRLPRSVRLPFGYTIKVKLVTRKEMTAAGGPDCDGLWTCDDQTIRVVRTLPPARQRWLLGHELVHALNDFVHLKVNQGVMKG